jgi:hypothetical protein
VNVLLVEPEFPIPPKSRNHHNFLPIGLLKLAAYHKDRGDNIELVRGLKPSRLERPDLILVTSLFTYWSKYVKQAVQFYKQRFPAAEVVVGGIYASLMPDHCRQYTGCDQVCSGVHPEAEKKNPLYELVDVDYQIIHASRGCIRKCRFCGVWKIESSFEPKSSIKDEIVKPRLVFYDNNFLANPYVEHILDEIINFRLDGRRLTCESQSGFDGRKLTSKLARLLKKARFVGPKIAWDNAYSDSEQVEKQIQLLIDAGFARKDISVFMVYDWDYDFATMELKRIKCWQWKVQITDCRFRPLDQTFDEYDPRKRQSGDDYYIHPKWTDQEVKQFRKNVRRQNICVRHGFQFHSYRLERKGVSKQQSMKLRGLPREKVVKLVPDAWFPGDIHRPPQISTLLSRMISPDSALGEQIRASAQSTPRRAGRSQSSL